MRLPRIPTLVIADGPEQEPGLADPLAPGVEVCRDALGDVFAYCSTLNGRHRVNLPDLASFCFERDGGEVTAVPHRPLDPEVLRETYWHYVLPLILPALGTEVLHASAVLTSHGVVALCGESGAGKSTLAFGLCRRGYPAWADDAVALDLSGPFVRVLRLPFAIRLRPSSASFFRSATREVASAGHEPAPLRALCVLTRLSEPEGQVAVERLQAGNALSALLTHGYSFSLKPERKRQMIEQYLSLVSRVQVFDIRFVPSLDWIPAILDRIEQVIHGQLAESPR